jgi:AraC-like DNA-binding protein
MPRDTPYREHLPHPDLRGHVACYWSIRCTLPPADAHDDAVVPDACLDFLFDLAGDTAELVGTMTRPLPVARGGTMDLLGVRFRPGAIRSFVSLHAAEVTDGIVPLDDAWGADAPELYQRLRSAPGTTARVALLDRTLLARLAVRGDPDPVTLSAARVLERAGGRMRVDHLARATGMGSRQLERRFLAAVGVSPKTACRVIRFQVALAQLHAEPGTSLTRVALRAGYHDQAHLTRDFGAFAGEPPGTYRRRRGLDGDDAFLQDDPGPDS